MGKPTRTDASLPLERPFVDGLLALQLSRDVESFPFAAFAHALIEEHGGSIEAKLEETGFDEVFWDLSVMDQLLTLHSQHFLGVFLCATDEPSEKVLRRLIPFAERFVRESTKRRAQDLATRRRRAWFLVGTCLILVLLGAYLSQSQVAHPLLIRARTTVAPLFWPTEEFSPEAWKQTPRGERYRLVKDLISLVDVAGISAEDAAEMLNGSSDQNLYAIKNLDGNLWYVLTLEFDDDRVSAMRVWMAHLDL